MVSPNWGGTRFFKALDGWLHQTRGSAGKGVTLDGWQCQTGDRTPDATPPERSGA